MVRIDTQSVVVLGFALMASFGTALTIRHLEGDGMAQAATPVAEAAVGASGTDAQVVKGADGHYWAEANIDGKAVRVLVDTGASVVALTRNDAARLGLKLTPEDFSGTLITASGRVRAAPVELQAVAVAGARVERVQALVVERGLPHSLLGMSYLGRLSAFTATPASLTLRP